MSRIALVTGGSRGIGAAISTALQATGYTVAATYAGNDEKAAAFTAETGIKTYKWDVSDYDACAAGIAAVEADLGLIDILVNNAGITRDAPFHKMACVEYPCPLNDGLLNPHCIGLETATLLTSVSVIATIIVFIICLSC